jgi:hypothetical protein
MSTYIFHVPFASQSSLISQNVSIRSLIVVLCSSLRRHYLISSVWSLLPHSFTLRPLTSLISGHAPACGPLFSHCVCLSHKTHLPARIFHRLIQQLQTFTSTSSSVKKSQHEARCLAVTHKVYQQSLRCPNTFPPTPHPHYSRPRPLTIVYTCSHTSRALPRYASLFKLLLPLSLPHNRRQQQSHHRPLLSSSSLTSHTHRGSTQINTHPHHKNIHSYELGYWSGWYVQPPLKASSHH